jgi:hypothetical protein
MNKFKAIICLGIPALLLAAAMVLVLSNLSDVWVLHLYTKDVHVARSVLMLLIAAAGIILWLLCLWMLPVGRRAWRAAKAADLAAKPQPPPVAK